MTSITKHVLATLAVLVVGAAAAFALYVGSGAYNFAAVAHDEAALRDIEGAASAAFVSIVEAESA